MNITTAFSVIPIPVADQDEALRFYTEKLGFEKRADVTFGPGLRLLTVSPRDQLRPVIALARSDTFPASQQRSHEPDNLWVIGTEDCYRVYEILLERGVSFVSPPARHIYGIEAIFSDPYGNRFLLLEQFPRAFSVCRRDNAA
ncbi:MAG TPA: VOC family protein [Ktedonobacteraceae bacterium]|nr:VOC family protein [Ktedonobacteraceae bacterium]